MKSKETKTIAVNYIARVEGEGALKVEIEGGAVKDVQLKIFEPPRFFEAFLRGRDFREAPDITARICGICPIAYQMSSVRAMEDALGYSPQKEAEELRRLVYCGEWVESHVLHIYMLHAPDFLNFSDAIRMAKKFPKEVERGLKLKKAGNSIVSLLGGRAIHPVNARVGGFYKFPEKGDFKKLKDELLWAKDAAIETVRWTAGFEFPEFERDYECLSLVHPTMYPLDVGEMQTNKGLKFPVRDFDEWVKECQVPHSNALQSTLLGRGSYLVGPMARYNINYRKLHQPVRQLAEEIGFPSVCNNPFKSIVVRSLEVFYAICEALRIIEGYEKPTALAGPPLPKKAEGFGCTEAPRGALYHRYRMDEKGIIEFASIVPPTSQNQKTMEEDLKEYIADYVALTDSELGAKCEAFIRNYDPCISCAAHFLKLNVERK